MAAFVRGPTEADYLRGVADCVREASRYEMPLICHIYPRNPSTGQILFTPEEIAWAARCAFEVGADVVKVLDSQEIVSPFERLARGQFADGKIDMATLKLLLLAHQAEMEIRHETHDRG